MNGRFLTLGIGDELLAVRLHAWTITAAVVRITIGLLSPAFFLSIYLVCTSTLYSPQYPLPCLFLLYLAPSPLYFLFHTFFVRSYFLLSSSTSSLHFPILCCSHSNILLFLLLFLPFSPSTPQSHLRLDPALLFLFSPSFALFSSSHCLSLSFPQLMLSFPPFPIRLILYSFPFPLSQIPFPSSPFSLPSAYPFHLAPFIFSPFPFPFSYLPLSFLPFLFLAFLLF